MQLNKIKSILFIMSCTVFLSMPRTGYSSLNETIEKFNSFYKSYYEEGINDDDDNGLRSLWDLMDETVLAYLNSTENVDSLEHLYSLLAGYQAPKISKKTTIGKTVFYDEPDEDTSTYLSKSTKVDNKQYIFCIYRFNPYRPGRLSIFIKQKGIWSRIIKFDGQAPIILYYFPKALSRGYFFTLEEYTLGDRQECDIKIWHIRKEMVRQILNYDSLVDYSAPEVRTFSLTVPFTRIPIYMCEPVLGERLLYQIVFSLNKKGEMEAEEHSLTPWLEVLNDYFGAISETHDSNTDRFTRDGSVVKKLHKDYCPTVTAHNGDLVKGVGYVEVESIYEGNKPWHIELRREAGRWYISQVTHM